MTNTGGVHSIILVAVVLIHASFIHCTNTDNIHNRKLLQNNGPVTSHWFDIPASSPQSSSAHSPRSQITVTQISNITDPSAIPANATCPTISLSLNSIEIYDAIINNPNGIISVQCYTKDGISFDKISFATTSDTVRSPAGARYKPDQVIANITCGDAVTCRVTDTASPHDTGEGEILADGGCYFDFRHFTQLSYQEPLSAWTCNKPPVRYTLQCVQCADPNFPWTTAVALSGPPLDDPSQGFTTSSFNSIMVIVSVCVVSIAMILVVTAVVVRSRRRNVMDAHMIELIRSAQEERMRSRNEREFKPPDLYVIGLPNDSPPPPGYTGPIVVLNYGEDYVEDGVLINEFARHDSEGRHERSINNDESNGSERCGLLNERSGSIRAIGGSNEERIVRWPSIAIAHPVNAAGKEEEVEADEEGNAQSSPGEPESTRVSVVFQHSASRNMPEDNQREESSQGRRNMGHFTINSREQV